MLNIATRKWFKSIAIVLIATFLSLDIAWANPQGDSASTGTLQVPLAFQQGDASGRQRELAFDMKLGGAVASIGKHILGDAEHPRSGLSEKYLRRMQEVLFNNIGSEMFNGISLFQVTIQDEVVLIPYTRDGKSYIFQVAAKDTGLTRKLLGYEWPVESKEYAVKVVPHDFGNVIAPEAKAPAIAPEAPITASEPAKEEAPKEDAGPTNILSFEPLTLAFIAGLTGPIGIGILAVIGVVAVVIYLKSGKKKIEGTKDTLAGQLQELRTDIMQGLKTTTRKNAVERLRFIEDPRATALIILALKDEEAIVRKEAAYSLMMRKKDARAVEPLTGLLSDQDADVREQAAEALEKQADSRAIEALAKTMLNDESDVVRARSADALGMTRDPICIGPLLKALKDPEKLVRDSASQALALINFKAYIMPKSAFKHLVEATKDVSPEVCWNMANLLGDSNDKRAVEPLMLLLNNKNGSAVCSAAEALGKLGDKRALKPLIARLKDPSYEIDPESAAYGIITALGKFGDKSVIGLIKETAAKYDSYGDIQKFAREAIDAINTREGEAGPAKLLFLEPLTLAIIVGLTGPIGMLILTVIGIISAIIYLRAADNEGASIEKKEEDLGGPSAGVTGPGEKEGGIPPLPVEIKSEPVAEVKVKAEDDIKAEVARLFKLVEGTVNNRKAKFVLDASAIIDQLNQIPELKGKFTDIKLDMGMPTSQLRESAFEILKRLDGIKDVNIPQPILNKASSLQADIKKVEIDTIVASIMSQAMKLEEGQRLIIGIETDWIPGMDEKGWGTQHDAMINLVREVDAIGVNLKALGIDNVEVIHRKQAELKDSVLGRARETKTDMKNIIIFGSNNTIEAFLKADTFTATLPTGETERAFLAGIDPVELKKAYADARSKSGMVIDIDFIQLLSMALELSLGKEPPRNPIIVSYDPKARVVIFLPKAAPENYELIKSNHEAQRSVLAAL